MKILKGNMAILEKQVKKTNNIWAKALILLLKYIRSESKNQYKNLMKNPKYGLWYVHRVSINTFIIFEAFSFQLYWYILDI